MGLKALLLPSEINNTLESNTTFIKISADYENASYLAFHNGLQLYYFFPATLQ